MNPNRIRDNVVRDIWKFSVCYFAGLKSTKKCLVSEEDLIAMYSG